MYKKSTLNESSDYYHVVKKEKNQGLKPKKDTLAFLMQFARVYHAEKDIPSPLSGMVLN